MLIVVSILLLLSNLYAPVNIFKNFMLKIFSPIPIAFNRGTDYVSSVNLKSRIFFDVFDENIRMKHKIRELQHRNASLESIKKEYELLSKLYEYNNNIANKDFLAVRVLKVSPELYFSEMLIDKGGKDGLKIDQPVVTIKDDKYILTGRISEVYKDYSKVILITSSDFRCAVEINDEYKGVLKGNNNWVLNVKYISPDAEISKGQSVNTAGIGGIFPKGLLIGRITEVEKLEFSKGQEAFVNSILYPQNSKIFFVLKE